MLSLHLALSGLQKRRRRAGVCASMFAPVENGPGSDGRRGAWTKSPEDNFLNGENKDLKKEDISWMGLLLFRLCGYRNEVEDGHFTRAYQDSARSEINFNEGNLPI